MKITELIRVDREHPDPAAIERAAACLRRGGLVAFPTETVYGLGVHALDREAVLRLFEAKQRPANDPLIVHVSSIDDVAALAADVPAAARELAARFWPGPLTLVLRRGAAVPREVTAGLDTVAVRVPSHPVARALIEAARLPVAAPSANLFSRPSPTRAAHVLEDLDGRIDMVVDGGPTDVGVESTVVDLTGEAPTILRPGAIGIDALTRVMPNARTRATAAAIDAGGMPSPGLLSKHYAPRAHLVLFRGPRAADAVREREAQLRANGARVATLAPGASLADFAARLYAALREFDAVGIEVILAREPDQQDDLGRAIRDRLQRAAAEVIETT